MNLAALIAPDVRRLVGRANAPILLALGCLAIVFVLPRVPWSTRVHSVLVTFDISQSMFVEDAAYAGSLDSRLAAARRAGRDLLQQLPCGSHVGWSVFTGRRVLTLTTPLEVCRHYDALVSSLERIDARMRWANASIIGKGLHQAMRAASAIGPDVAVVYFTDGHEAPPLRDGARGMPAVDVDAVSGLIVGVGGQTPTRIPRHDESGNTIGYWGADDVVQQSGALAGSSREELSALQLDHLEHLARLSGLTFHRLATPEALLSALDAADGGREEMVERDIRALPAVVALLALLWRFRPSLRLSLSRWRR